MTVNSWILRTALVILAATASNAQIHAERCGYMIQIPRPERPELGDQNFDGLTWNQRPLIPAEDRLDVCMDGFQIDQHSPNMGYQTIFIEEEIEGDVPIAKLNYKGTQTPYVAAPFHAGSFSLLVPVLRRIPNTDGDWHLVITNRQDFETPGMQYYMFEVRVPDETMVAYVVLHIVNIDDNAPIINLSGPCKIAERGEVGVTSCKYEVSDVDGQISTSVMRFTIDSDRGDEQVFELVRENIPNEWMKVNMVMHVKEPLNYDNPLHIFRVTAWDSLPNRHDITMMVEVENVEGRAPRWVDIFAVQEFNEKTRKSFRIEAVDGDTGIRKPIHYRLEKQDIDKDLDLFQIEAIGDDGHQGAWLHVGPIDRDAIMREVFYLTIVAYKYGDNDMPGSPSFETPANIIIIINDVNDNAPEPLHKEYTIDIPEETATTLDLEEFGFHDIDLGENAQYTVRLESVYPEKAHEAFYIAPEVGYQRQFFIIGTRDHSKLDYEVPEFQKIQLRAVATDKDNQVGIATININLINWNDELPIFERDVTRVAFPETKGIGYHVGQVVANDRDIDDKVEYTLLGNANDYLRIDKYSGDIFVTADDAFNYHRQNEISIQIRADDTLGDGPYNSATCQLVIELEDVNNTPPTLRLPRGSPQVEENVPQGFVISSEVAASDPDTTARLQFHINWDASYATKQGRETPAREFHNCIEIKTHYPDENQRGIAVGRVEVREIREGVTIDYEEFEVLYLSVIVRDLNTELGVDHDESTLTVTITDMNDNAPQWAEGQLTQQFRVREVSATGVVIGSVFATDIDGPLYNQVRYTILPKEGTPPDLVTIGFTTGQLTVQRDQAIDADEPPRHHLYYTVIASDECSLEDKTECPPDPTFHETKGDLEIEIIDTNNKVPRLETDKFRQEVEIYENAADGDEVVTIVASDLDRDQPYSSVSYQINYGVNQRLRDFFAVDLGTGKVFVNYEGSDVLDRDNGEDQHRIFFTIVDNFLSERDGNRNQIEAEVLVKLLDVNDNAPEMPEPNLPHWTVSENLKKGIRLEPDIFARDRDEPGNPNSKVAYEILGLTADRDIVVPDLFEIITIEKDRGIDQTGELETAVDLQGYWGTYEIHIQAYDHGVPPLASSEKYQLIIRPYNYHAPEFIFPKAGTPIRLSRDRAVVSGELSVAGAQESPLDRISATDEDGLHAGTVTFSVVGDDEAADYFDIWNDVENSGMLVLTRPLPEGFQQFKLTVRATDAGDEPGARSSDVTVTVVFIPHGDPVFEINTDQVAFVEFEAGLEERHELRTATDPKNILCVDDCYVIYYTIIAGNEGGQFALDGNVLYLVRELNRDEQDSHTLQVAASNSPAAAAVSPASTLTVTVTVREANPRPHFSRPIYTAGISTNDVVDRQLLTVQATHTDGLAITYEIDQETMVVDPTLEVVQEQAFELNPVTGQLVLKIQPTASMHGMFEFDVVATDTNGAEGRSEVKVYLISSRNRVYFLFLNPQDFVREHTDFIADTFSAAFEMTCNIDETLPATDSNGIPSETSTEVRAHFIQDDLPVPSEVVTDLRDDTELLRTIQNRLWNERLSLSDVQAGGAPTVGGGEPALAVRVLAGLAAGLALLCLVLLATFIVRSRALNRRIAALSMTKYSSVESDLNRMGLAAPGTNKHAIEGSNPIWNETIKAPDFDAISEVSNDSDLIGIEDLPQFRSDYFPTEEDRSMRDLNAENLGVTSARNPIASHENNFGFNATPFSPEFANTQFRSK